MVHPTIRSQLKDNFVAIVSLIVAIMALCYTTWREEATEKNRTLRTVKKKWLLLRLVMK
jgi:hypothetical protein